jgi:hypothetical protein
MKAQGATPEPKKELYPSRVILTTYPGQTGIKPVDMDWGAEDPQKRGPVVASRHPDSIKQRNAIGAFNGSYSVYKALATAIGQLSQDHRPNYHNTEPPWPIPFQPSWATQKIVSMDPWGHLAPQLFKPFLDAGGDLRPTIAVTKAHLKVRVPATRDSAECSAGPGNRRGRESGPYPDRRQDRAQVWWIHHHRGLGLRRPRRRGGRQQGGRRARLVAAGGGRAL